MHHFKTNDPTINKIYATWCLRSAASALHTWDKLTVDLTGTKANENPSEQQIEDIEKILFKGNFLDTERARKATSALKAYRK